MAEGIYRSTVGALVDRDRLAVSGRHAGPAGVSGVELPDGSVWEVDHADPSVPVLLEVDAMDASTSPLLVTAFGGDGAMFLADDAIRMTGGDPGGNDPAVMYWYEVQVSKDGPKFIPHEIRAGRVTLGRRFSTRSTMTKESRPSGRLIQKIQGQEA